MKQNINCKVEIIVFLISIEISCSSTERFKTAEGGGTKLTQKNVKCKPNKIENYVENFEVESVLSLYCTPVPVLSGQLHCLHFVPEGS